MTRPRHELVSVEDTPYYHCVSRCVRRAFLCGEDQLSGRSFEHRRQWIVERLGLLTKVFAIDLCAYAIMGNHYHLVVRIDDKRAARWSDNEVLERWCRLFAAPTLIERHRHSEALTDPELVTVHEILALWRNRLQDLSWFMRCLNEPIARRANREDDCTGRFWEGRFKCQALLDEGALLTAMAYVDLNPVRAGTAAGLEDSAFTSVQARLFEIARGRSRHTIQPTVPVLPFRGERPDVSEFFTLPFNLQSYLALVDETGRIIRDDKRGHLGAHITPILTTLGIDATEWLPTVSALQERFELVIGAPDALVALACNRGRSWFRGRSAAKRLYRYALAA